MNLFVSFFTFYSQHSLSWRSPVLLKESKCCFSFRSLGTLTVSSVVTHLHPKADSGVYFTPRKPPSCLSVQLFCFSSTVTAQTLGSSTRSRSRRGTLGTPPAPCGWAAGCRRGRPWRRRWTSRRTPSPPPAAWRS